jgi:hypothetical protein
MIITRNILAIVSTTIALILSIPIIVLVLPFWIVSFLTHAIYRLIQPTISHWDEIIQFEPIIGWKPKNDLNVHYIARDKDICHVRTDSQGWPGTTSLSESTMVVFGDSFAFGYGVDFDTSYAEINPSLRIKPIGAPGYNMVQELLLMRQLSSQLRNRLVIWFICLENDLYDNLLPNKPNFYRTPFVRSPNGRDDWEVVTSHVSPTKWPCASTPRPYYPMLAKLCTQCSLSQRVFSACNFLVKEANVICQQAEAQLVVVTIPNKNQLSQRGQKFLASYLGEINEFDADFPDQKIGEICRLWNIPFMPSKRVLEASDYKEYDTHWNEQGNKKIAKMLSHLYESFSSGTFKVRGNLQESTTYGAPNHKITL